MSQAPARHYPRDEAPKGYASYKTAMDKLMKEIPEGVEDPPTTVIIAMPNGRFMPAACGHKALQLGLHFRGIACIG